MCQSLPGYAMRLRNSIASDYKILYIKSDHKMLYILSPYLRPWAGGCQHVRLHCLMSESFNLIKMETNPLFMRYDVGVTELVPESTHLILLSLMLLSQTLYWSTSDWPNVG